MIPKFRAWDTYEKEMLENVTPLFDDSNSMIAIITDFQIKGSPGTSEIEIGSYDTTFNWDEFPYVIMQSTGLKDKNGVEIFEGDICIQRGEEPYSDENMTLDDDWEYTGIIKFQDFAYWLQDNEGFSKWLGTDCDEIEVIGNVWDNPELLEGTE
ncbi:YopX family protein [Enterococcus faecalis]|uniref:YopX family protein n=2 Tax=Enterococcus faecalis TaxID=1351 RepID=UPI0035A62EBA